ACAAYKNDTYKKEIDDAFHYVTFLLLFTWQFKNNT
ncbi:MAG: hypothetical protein ACI836_000710, partial [Saprospiraceae bacterium]